MLPAAEADACPGAAEVVLRVHHGQAAIALDALDVRRRLHAAGGAAEDIE